MVDEMVNVQIQVVRRRTRDGYVEVLQQRTKTKWIDGSTTNNGRYTWTEWEDVPIVDEE